MGTGQTILSIGALMLLSFVLLTFNRNTNVVDLTMSQNTFRMEALAIANNYAESAKFLFFDEASLDTNASSALSDLTPSANLGLDGGDAGIADDFDDYHNMTLSDTGSSGVVYTVTFRVEYVTLSGNRMVTDNSQQYHKRMTISVFDSYDDPLITREVNGISVKDTLSISFIQSYWFYN